MKLYLVIINVFLFSLAKASEIENQCRSEAKIIALKTYETCVNGKKAEQVEALKQEYQERALQLKNEYENKIKNLNETPELANEDFQESSLHTEPTVVLKPATQPKSKNLNSSTKKVFKPKKESIKSNLKSATLKSPKKIDKAELNEITGQTENLEMTDPSLVQEL